MDDAKTQEALDALADLFLTQTLGEKAAPASRAAAAEQLQGPSPIRLMPKVAQPRTITRPAAPPRPVADDGPFIDEAEAAHTAEAPVLRFTGDAEDDAPAEAPGPAPTREVAEEDHAAAGVPVAAEAMVEAVVLGNLPGLSGPWLTQYAQLLADEAGPVLVVHVDEDDADGLPDGGASSGGGRLELELVEPTRPEGEAASRGSVRVPPMRGSGPDLALGLIDSMVRARVGKVSTILLHLEAGSDERRLSRLLAVDDWTLLCGHDEMAVAGAGALLGQLAAADGRVRRKQVALMVMGADAAAGQAAAARIAAAANQALDTPILTLGSHQRLGPVNVRQLGSFEDLGTLWPRLLAYLEDLAPPAAPPQEPSATPASAGMAPETPAPRPARDPAFDAILKAKAPEPRTRTADAEATRVRVTQTGTEVPPAVPASAGTGAPSNNPLSGAQDAPPRLASLVAAGAHGIEGGVALEARCPYQPLTELVLDHAGRLHLLRREVAVAGGEDESAGIRAAVVDLSEAGRWVADHVELLKLTMRDATFDAQAQPTLHLFTDKAHLATRVVAKLGDQVKLHLLQQVKVGSASTWFCTPLS